MCIRDRVSTQSTWGKILTKSVEKNKRKKIQINSRTAEEHLMGDKSQSGPANTYMHDVLETNYPYIQVKQNLWNQPQAAFRRMIAPMNPFRLQQIPTQDRAAFGARYGNQWFIPNVYPNAIKWDKMFPTHYDPLSEQSRGPFGLQNRKYAPGPFSHYVISADKLPRACVRQIQNFKRCAMINGDEKCEEEINNLMDICPTWALDTMKEKGRFLLKVRAIQNQQYRRAMEVAEYNQGRTPADVSDRTWVDGTRLKLRPDTMWADERYTKITQAEINEAKKRVAEREERKKKHGHHDAHHEEHHHDPSRMAVKQDRPLYPQAT
eukprot:TRINITY_DN2401_c0_g1_i1.p2 TRINITY_DN2401_c0_g1~~TRINITY_DN2401_c0_g1_i1.p2  ORF type:complete len:321 (-),score=116.07 TRINITY_DN2401_c0_g1_i1:191-1153(-)